MQYAAQVKDRLAGLDAMTKAWSQALSKAPLVLPHAQQQFIAAEQEASQIANAVLTLPTGSVDEQLARMDLAIETLAQRLAGLRRVVYPQSADSMQCTDGEFEHVGIIQDDGFDTNDQDEEEDTVDDLMVDILVADLLQGSNAEDDLAEEEDS